MLLNYHIGRIGLGSLCVGRKRQEIYTMTLALLLYLALSEITTTEPERTKQHLMIEHDGFLNVLLGYGENLQCVV